MIFGEPRQAASGQPGALAVIRDLAVADETGAAEAIADPQAALGRREQRHDVAGKEPLAAHTVDVLETHAVEAEQAAGGSHPEIAIARLREDLYAGRRAVVDAPGAVMELGDAQVRR